MTKMIDPLAVRDAVKAGQLEVYLRADFEGNIHIMLRDTENGDCTEIGMVPARSIV